jgi:hypothetical protein
MAGSRDRLVRRIQRRQQSRRAGIDPAGSATPCEIAELEDRVRRLQAMGVEYAQIRLSPEVALRGAIERSVRVGGECVATEV